MTWISYYHQVTEEMLLMLIRKLKSLLPCPQTDLWVFPTAHGSYSPPSRVSGSCTSSYSSSAGRRTPSPRGSAVGSLTPVTGEKGAHTQRQWCGRITGKGENISVVVFICPSHDQLPSDHHHLHFHLFIGASVQDLFLLASPLCCRSIRPKTMVPKLVHLELPRGSIKKQIRISSPDLQRDNKWV